MREKPRDEGRLRHIIQAIDNVARFIDGKQLADLENESVLYFAIVKNIEIVGEAAYMLTPEFKESHPNTTWKPIVGMRHYLVHGYYHIGLREIWNVAVNDLPKLRPQIIEYLRELEADNGSK